MAKISASIQVKNNIKLVRKNMENLRTAIPKIAKTRLNEVSVEIARRMSKPGKKPKYPIPWTNIKQRIKVIIMIMRKQGFLPYVRTQAHERGWKSESTERGSKVYTSVKGSKYLYGTMRNTQVQEMFAGRWPLIRIVYDAVISKLPKKVKESLKNIPKVTS